jgi:hypothetical protein
MESHVDVMLETLQEVEDAAAHAIRMECETPTTSTTGTRVAAKKSSARPVKTPSASQSGVDSPSCIWAASMGIDDPEQLFAPPIPVPKNNGTRCKAQRRHHSRSYPTGPSSWSLTRSQGQQWKRVSRCWTTVSRRGRLACWTNVAHKRVGLERTFPATPDAAQRNHGGWDTMKSGLSSQDFGLVANHACRKWAFESKDNLPQFLEWQTSPG